MYAVLLVTVGLIIYVTEPFVAINASPVSLKSLLSVYIFGISDWYIGYIKELYFLWLQIQIKT